MKRRGTKRAQDADREPRELAAAGDQQLAKLFASVGRPAVLMLATSLLVSAPLMASEGIVPNGAGASWHVLWLALAFVSLAGSTLIAQQTARWSWADLCVLLLIAWHVVSALVCDGNQRHAWNAVWQWASYGAIAVVMRQQLMPGKETRALVAVMLALALAVSFQAYYQYGYSQPILRAQYEKDPEAVLRQMRELGIDTTPGSPGRANAENRIKSVEPTAEFGLTNSLAGYLLPWLLIALAIAFWSVQRDGLVLTIVATLVIALVIFGVVLLTKSRTAVLAAVGGCALILLYCRRSGWQLDWRLPAGLAAAGMVLGLIAVVAKGLDVEVLSEAPKSVLYRIEYWQGTAALIAEEPIFGVGPGNFKERYPKHKLPQASETISDPHNFLLEIWSTAGTPALLALLGLMGTTAWQIGRSKSVSLPASPTPDVSPLNEPASVELAPFGICAGAVLGLLLAGILGFVAQDPLLTTRSDALLDNRDEALGVPLIFLAAIPAYAFCYFLLRDWVERGELPRAAVICALIAILVNLLAAGAAIFAGVVNAAWLLWAISLQENATQSVTASSPQPTTHDYRQRTIGWIGTVCCLAALFGCLYTEYWPIMNSGILLGEAMAERRYDDKVELYERAVAADPYSPDMKQARAVFYYSLWQYGKQIPKYWVPFERALQSYEQSSPHHYTQHEQRGKWLLSAAHRVRSPEYLAQSAEAFAAAVRCYPNSAYLRAQLAFVYDELGRTAEARVQAEEAARLDALCPHVEQKLENRKLFDPRWTIDQQSLATETNQGPNAAEFVNKLRHELTPKAAPQS